MKTADRHRHWDHIYTTKREAEVSWFEERPNISLELIRATGATTQTAIIDIGGGTSRLVDALVVQGFGDVTVLDISGAALSAAKTRLGAHAAKAKWVVADVTNWQPAKCYDLWHDRATFHFLTDLHDQQAYVGTLAKALRLGGAVIIGTFAPDGPERCSGLPVTRHDAASLWRLLGPDFDLRDTRREEHRTPSGASQHFQFSLFRRLR